VTKTHHVLRAVVLVTSALLAAEAVEAQLSYTRGQPVSPAYEGFEVNPDGSYNLVFGYMNRNWEEEIDVPIGEGNYFAWTTPGGLDDLGRARYDPSNADMGQPTHFLPRRNRFTFEVRVPADFGEEELVWTLTTQGETRRAFASLRQDLLIDNMVIASETGALGAGTSDPETRSNVPPVVEIEGGRTRNAVVGQPVTIVALVTDDRLPLSRAARAARAAEQRAEAARTEGAGPAAADRRPQAAAVDEDEEEEVSPEIQALRRALNEPGRVTVGKVVGLHFTWFVYRGMNSASFEPIQVKPWEDSRVWMNSPWSPSWVAPPIPEDDRWVVDVTFDEPGTYVLRGRADDGSLYADEEITVNVTPLVN